MVTVAAHDGISVRALGTDLARLTEAGFLEITGADGHDSIAKVTRAGLAALGAPTFGLRTGGRA